MPTVTVTTALCQLCSSEDVEPLSLQNDTAIACLVADGHSGKDCTATIDHHGTDILEVVLSQGVEAGMALCAQLCSQHSAGAMVVIACFHLVDRTLQISSMGDASCIVYQGQRRIFSQPHHSCSTVAQLWPAEAAENNIHLCRPQPTMVPMPDGRSMTIVNKSTYFQWNSGHRIQGASFVGHSGMSRLRAHTTELVVPAGPFHVVMATDGVFDVMHEEETLFRADDVTAESIVAAAKQRWTEPYVTALEQEQYAYFNVEGFFIFNPYPTVTSHHAMHNGQTERILHQQPNPDGTLQLTCSNGQQRSNVAAESVQVRVHNTGADDISALVLRVSD
jgi:hypothetical protein